MNQSGAARVVILGGGFAGISAARELGRLARNDPSIEVHLINDENFFVFQPLLPEVVSCGIEPGHILNPIRQLCPAVQFHCATVTHLDLEAQTATLLGSDERRQSILRYDHLIWGLGLKMDLSRVPGMAEHSYPIKTLVDAFHLRNRVLGCLEEADLEADEGVRKKLLTVVTVGGGYSGVETVGEINDLIRSVLPFYPRARRTGPRTVLVHPSERILQELDPDLGEFAQAKLRERGVEIILRTRVTEATGDGVVLSNGEMVVAATVICTVGNSPHPLLGQLALPQDRGRILVDEFLRVKGYQNLWALGDAALIPDMARGGYCPPTAQYAMREGLQCARNVLPTIQARPRHPFRFGGLGQLAVVGRHVGVGRLFRWKISGVLAWFLHRLVYLGKVPGFRCKVRVGIDWALDLLFPRDITMMELRRTEQLARAHYREGEVIIRQGEIGDHFYIIDSGQVEVLQEEPGAQPKRLRVLGTGASFGEIALLNAQPRTATVRCLTPVNVVKLSRRDFLTLVGSHDIFRRIVEQQARSLTKN